MPPPSDLLREGLARVLAEAGMETCELVGDAEELERRHIVRALEHTKGNKRRAMELLGLSPETFYRRLEEFGLHKKSE